MKPVMDRLADMRREHVGALERSLTQIVESLAACPEVERISVIGSYARGRADLFTDLDVLMVMRTDLGPVERLRMLYGLIAAPVDVDVLCYTPQEFEALADHGWLKAALANERVLYEKTPPAHRPQRLPPTR